MSRRVASSAPQPGVAQPGVAQTGVGKHSTGKHGAGQNDAGRIKPRQTATVPAQQQLLSGWGRWFSIVLVVAAFVAGLVLDTTALLRLVGASLGGQFGLVPRIIAIFGLLVCASPVLRLAYRRLMKPPLASPRGRTARVRAERPKSATDVSSATLRSASSKGDTPRTQPSKPRRRAAKTAK